jgi:hypothetical protein
MLMDLVERKPGLLLSTPMVPTRPMWSPDSRKIMYSTVDSMIAVLDIETREQDTLWRGTKPAWSPDGQWVAYYDRVPIFVRNVATGEKRLIAARWNLNVARGGPVFLVHEGGEELVWSPDSRYLLYNARASYDIQGTGTEYMITRISDGATTRRTGENYVPWGACWFEWVAPGEGAGNVTK